MKPEPSKGSEMRGYDSSKLKQVRLRHECKTRWLAKVNKNLTKVQRSRIQATPFKWLMCMPEKIKISGILLRELSSRWVESSGGFRIRNRVVSFSPLDVCFALGLRIVGENVHFDQEPESHTKRLLEGKELTVKTVFEQLVQLHRDDDVEDFCRLYILLGLAEFYFPNTKATVHGGFLKILDDINSLGKYNWGVAVYDFLVNSLTRASISLREEKNSSQLYITGCAVVLQIWALEHVLVCCTRNSNISSMFPRFLKWRDVHIGEKKISASLEKNLVIDELSATSQDLLHDVVVEALDQAPNGFAHWKHNTVTKMKLRNETRALLAQNIQLKARISQLEQELRAMKNQLFQSELSPLGRESYTQVDDIEMDNDREVIRASRHKEHQDSNIYTRLKEHPRKRVGSV